MGYGLFQDVWAPVVESIISVVVAILGGYFWGLEGVLLGTIVSMALIVCIWKPYFLFKEGLKTSVWGYWVNFAKYTVSLFFAIVAGNYCAEWINFDPSQSFIYWGLYAVCIMLIFSIIYFVFLYMLNEGMRDFASRIITMAKSKFGSKK